MFGWVGKDFDEERATANAGPSAALRMTMLGWVWKGFEEGRATADAGPFGCAQDDNVWIGWVAKVMLMRREQQRLGGVRVRSG